jgi:hypothetical protein
MVYNIFLNISLGALEACLVAGKHVPEKDTLYDKYFPVSAVPAA